MFIVVGQTPEATRKRLEPPRIVCDLSVESAICDPRANPRKVAEMFRNSALFNNSEHGRNGRLRAGRAIIEGDVASSRRRSL
jgi:hypothetical protein